MRALRLPALLTVGAALALAACGRSPPTTFFTLVPVRADAARGQFAGEPVQVRAVHIPPQLDRNEIVTASSDDQLQVHQFQQWGAPLADMIRQVLTQDLTARLPAGMVLPAAAPPDPHERGLVVAVQTFQAQGGGSVVLEAGWTLLNPGGQPMLRRQVRFQQAARGGTDAQVRAQSVLLGQLADSIVRALSSAGS